MKQANYIYFEIVGTEIFSPLSVELARQPFTLAQSGGPSLVESFIELKYFHGVATPALLCHREPARRIQSPLRVKEKALVLYGIREQA